MHYAIEIAGVDEVGVGCIAGPVVAAAVMFQGLIPKELRCRLDDSKKVKIALREQIFMQLMNLPQTYIGIAAASVAEILVLNIKKAAGLAMQRAVHKLSLSPKLVLVDGNSSPDFGCMAQPIIKGDGLSFSIAAASIVAKVIRDRLMARLSKKWPAYGWDKNVGYPTVFHRQALKEYGCSPHHRQGFITVKQLSFQMNFLNKKAAFVSKML
ncbi:MULTISPECIES: ribonuclease HII [Commensalibacter]|uniref:Ribonuclease HII n=2 Tax=Commensalibacter TaxID=1079922 RepID=W7E552_9PROT|nr:MULTISPECIES: ribonuclease HII [Commensalibacter]EUK18201.1 ribonuclease HII [Commensalibacter papalotli (ex Servin-Garciduenas et al. 2014)]CAI3937817.1 Ribonuclease HII (RnhB) (PDB:1EKE) [Commensalibacter papalotli (ex Botero et al. 2024)]CAI3937823.1 Ribonuclease HII (RnhB) (PDB:1EKE) [Commensalibacter papalotli (ex Botero et al. 2024)]